MAFKRTESAARAEKQSKWSLIEAIAEDAVDAGVGIASGESKLQAKRALEKAGNEQSDGNINGLVCVARFDHESTAVQRKVWRRYGWTSIRPFATRKEWTPDAVFRVLDGQRLSVREIEALIRSSMNVHTGSPISLDAALGAWAQKMSNLLIKGAELAEEAARTDHRNLSAHAELALLIYERITERKLDAEIRELFDSIETH